MKKILSLILLGILSFSGYLYHEIVIQKYTGEAVLFTVKKGDSFAAINYRLYHDKLIKNMRVFHHYCKLKGLMEMFKAGTFKIPANSNMLSVIQTLVYGESITETITIPEGKNIFEIAKLLEEHKITTYKEFIDKARDASFAKSLSIPAATVEGYLFPETYKFEPFTSAEDIIKAMVALFHKKIQNLGLEKSKLSPHDTLIMASIIEKETGAAAERPMISGVFFNRLDKKMRLASDPTTIYGIYENYDGNIHKKDLLTKTPYNTYMIEGLPVGPICNPGLSALKATINPEKHDYLFFVSKNDGSHLFSKTYKEHLKGVNYFQKQLKGKSEPLTRSQSL